MIFIFNNYHQKMNIKGDIRYSQQPGYGEDLYIEKTTPIIETKRCMSVRTTNDRLTLYLADKLILLCKKFVVTVTRRLVLTNVPEYHPTTSVSTHKEADTSMVPHALEVINEEPGNEIDFFTKDTDCWILSLRR